MFRLPAKLLHDARHIVDPRTLPMRTHFTMLVKLPGMCAPGRSRRRSYSALQIDCDRKDEPMVIVGVLADQIDTARRSVSLVQPTRRARSAESAQREQPAPEVPVSDTTSTGTRREALCSPSRDPSVRRSAVAWWPG